MDADTDNDGLTFLSKLIDMAASIPRMYRDAPVDSEMHKTEKKELARQNMFDSMDLKSTGVVTFDEWNKFSIEHILAKMAALEPHRIRDHDNLEQFKTFLKAALAVGSTENNEFYWFLLELFTKHNNDKDGNVTLSDFLHACLPISCQAKLRTFEQKFCLHTIRIYHCKQIVMHAEQEQIDEECYLHVVLQSSIVQNMDTEVQIASSTHVGSYGTLQVSSNLHVTLPKPVKGDQPLQTGRESWSRETSVKSNLPSSGRVNFSPYLMHCEVQSVQTQKLIRVKFVVASVTDVYNLHEKPKEELEVSDLVNNKHTNTGTQSLKVKSEETATHQLLHHA
jgi:Ca2+-binding EF-hand superfamily protein